MKHAQECQRVLAALLFWVTCLTLNMFSGSVAGWYFDKNATPLPDVGYAFIPHVHWQELSDLYFLFVAVFTICRFMLPCLSPDWALFLRRFCLTHGMCMVLRALALNMTILPDANPTCQRLDSILTITSYAPFTVSCGDMMFSGHVVAWTIIAWMWQLYGKYALEKTLAWVGLLVGSTIMSATRQHYVIDIAVALYVGTTVTLGYHLLCTTSELYHHPRIGLVRWFEPKPPASSPKKQKTA